MNLDRRVGARVGVIKSPLLHPQVSPRNWQVTTISTSSSAESEQTYKFRIVDLYRT